MKLKDILGMVFNSCKDSSEYRNVQKMMHKNTKMKKFKRNIYDVKDVKKYAKSFHNVHFVFKYRFFVPVLELADKYFSYIKVKKISNTPQNYLLLRFRAAYKRATKKWHMYYISNGKLNNKSDRFIRADMKKSPPIRRITSILDWFLTVLLRDQAYRELFNFITLEYAKELQKEFKGGPANHLIYNANIVDDVHYFSMFTQVKHEIRVGVHTKMNKEKPNGPTANIELPKTAPKQVADSKANQ